MTTATQLLTAAEYLRLPDRGRRTELVRGEVIDMTSPGFRHGKTCQRLIRLLGNFVEEHQLGHVVANDSGIQTEHEPDTIRGPDVWYVSYAKLPPTDDEPEGYLDIVPDLVFEVLSPSNRKREVLEKVGEYLDLGVPVVCVLDPARRSAHLFRPDGPDEILQTDDELIFPDQLPGFAIVVKRLFSN